MENNQITKIETITAKQLTSYLDAMGLAQTLTEKEKVQFLEISQAFGLNPFKREIYCSKYGQGQMSIIVGYETYIKRAERSGQLDGWSVETVGKVEDMSLKAIITIHRKDRKFPFVHEVLYSEYVQTTKEGAVTKFWQKAYTMIKKVAMAQGFRLCFSDELGGIPYTKEEMLDTEDIAHVDVTAAPLIQIPTRDQQIANAKTFLYAAQDLASLNKAFKFLSKEMQQNAEVIEVASKCKVELSKQAV
jgi:phage recombination protein Bet